MSDEPTRTRRRVPDAVTRTIHLDGQALRVAIQPGRGQRLPLLLLSGIGVNLEVFEPFIDALDGGIGTLRVDLPGVGGSPATLFPQRLPGLARLVARMLDQLGYGEVNVLGISWGGGLAQQFAHQYPDRCRRLVLVSTGTGAIMVPGRLSALLLLLSPTAIVTPRTWEQSPLSCMAAASARTVSSRRSMPATYARVAREGTTGNCSRVRAGPVSTGYINYASRR